jgi:branched-chain amino acid transport system substrate-binding protein
MKRSHHLPLILVVLFVMAAVPLTAPAQEPVRVGALFNLTGGMAAIDLPGSNGAKLAVKLLNAKGGVLKGRPLEIVEIDTKTDLEATTKAANDLIAKGVVAGLGYGDSDYALLAGSVFQTHGIPFMTSGATDPAIPQKVGPAMFMTAFGDDEQAYALAGFAADRLKANRIVVWTNRSSDFTRGLAGYFKERFLRLGGEIVLDAQYENEKADFAPLLDRLAALRPAPDAIFIAGVPQDVAATVKAVRQVNKSLPILSGDGFDSDVVGAVRDPLSATGIFFSSHLFLGSARPEVAAFLGAYRKEYGHPPENSFAALGFDAVNLVAWAIERAGSTDPGLVTRALAETHGFKGVTGDIDLRRPNRVPLEPVTIVGVRDGTYFFAAEIMSVQGNKSE